MAGRKDPNSGAVIGDVFEERHFLSTVGRSGTRYVDMFDEKSVFAIEVSGVCKVVDRSMMAANGAHLDRISWSEALPAHMSLGTGPCPRTDEVLDMTLVGASLTAQTSIEDIRTLVRACLHVQFLRDLLPVRPIVHFVGPPDSGKSERARSFGNLLFGRRYNVTPLPESEKDFDVVASCAGHLTLDNVETPPRWLNDKLAVISTGATFARRRLWSDAAEYRVCPDTFLSVTSHGADWIRGDVADRSLVVSFRPFAAGERRNAGDLRKSVTAARPAFFSEALGVVAQVARRLANGTGPAVTSDRLGDFYWVGKLAAEVVGGAEEGESFVRGFNAAREARFNLAGANDPEVTALLDLLATGPWEGSAQSLLSELRLRLGCGQQDNMERNLQALSTWVRELKRRTSGLVVWELQPRPHGTPRGWRLVKRA